MGLSVIETVTVQAHQQTWKVTSGAVTPVMVGLETAWPAAQPKPQLTDSGERFGPPEYQNADAKLALDIYARHPSRRQFIAGGRARQTLPGATAASHAFTWTSPTLGGGAPTYPGVESYPASGLYPSSGGGPGVVCFSIAVRRSVGGPVKVEPRRDGAVVAAAAKTFTVPAGEWVVLELGALDSTGSTSVGLTVTHLAAVTGERLEWQHAAVFEGDTPGAGFWDGDTPGAAWAGTRLSSWSAMPTAGTLRGREILSSLASMVAAASDDAAATVTRTLDDGQEVTAAVVSATLPDDGKEDLEWGLAMPTVNVTLTRRPEWRLPPRSLSGEVYAIGPWGQFESTEPVPGDLPAELDVQPIWGADPRSRLATLAAVGGGAHVMSGSALYGQNYTAAEYQAANPLATAPLNAEVMLNTLFPRLRTGCVTFEAPATGLMRVLARVEVADTYPTECEITFDAESDAGGRSVTTIRARTGQRWRLIDLGLFDVAAGDTIAVTATTPTRAVIAIDQVELIEVSGCSATTSLGQFRATINEAAMFFGVLGDNYSIAGGTAATNVVEVSDSIRGYKPSGASASVTFTLAGTVPDDGRRRVGLEFISPSALVDGQVPITITYPGGSAVLRLADLGEAFPIGVPLLVEVVFDTASGYAEVWYGNSPGALHRTAMLVKVAAAPTSVTVAWDSATSETRLRSIVVSGAALIPDVGPSWPPSLDSSPRATLIGPAPFAPAGKPVTLAVRGLMRGDGLDWVPHAPEGISVMVTPCFLKEPT